MIDLFSLALTHGLLAIAAWRLVQRKDIDPVAINVRRMKKRHGGPHDAKPEATSETGRNA